MTTKSCRCCRYRRPITAMQPQETACHYLLDTGTPRGCPASHCTKWQARDEPASGWGVLLETIQRR